MSDDRSGWASTAELLAAAHGAGFTDVTARRLETWRYQKLLPRLDRGPQDGLRPVWLSPPGTVEQLLELCEIRDGATQRREVMTNTTARVRLWLRGADTDLQDVRTDLHTVIDDTQRRLDTELDKIACRGPIIGDPHDSRVEALGPLAEQIAGRRGEDAVPPRSRSARANRQRGLRALLHVFYTGQEPPPGTATGDDLYRALGLLPRWNHDRIDASVGGPEEPVGPWHDGTPIDLSPLAAVLSLPAFHRAISEASDDNLRYAREVAPTVGRQVLAIAGAASALSGWDGFLGLSALRRLPLLDHDIGLTIAVLALRHSDFRDAVEATVAAIHGAAQQIDQGLTELLGMPARDREERLARADPRDRERVKRIMRDVPSTGTVGSTRHPAHP